MKLITIKQEVFSLTDTQSTQELKTKYPAIVYKKDLRYKKNWLDILEKIKDLGFCSVSEVRNRLQAQKEAMDSIFRKSLQILGETAGLSQEDIELEWKKMELESLIENY
jgi:hypothetical protein